MKLHSLLPLAALASSFVIPDAETARSLKIQDSQTVWDKLPSSDELWSEWIDLKDQVKKTAGSAKHALDNAFDTAYDAAYDTAIKYDEKFQTAFAADAWLAEIEDDQDAIEHPPHHDGPHHGPPHDGPPHDDHPPHHGPPHDGPPHDGPPHHGPPHDGPPHHCPPHHGRPGHGRPHHRVNQTVYELISKSKYTTRLAKLLDEYPDLVKMLNGTKANYTVFAPTDRAFEKIPKHAPKPSKKELERILTYHVSPDFYPAGKILVTRTIPTALEAEYIKDVPQRLSTQIGFRGLTVNFYARVVAADIMGTNGVIHGIDSILLPPPKVVDIISFLPGEFSTLELALHKTGLYEVFNDTSAHNGGTLFAPSNFAFRLLGPRINAFLFSEHGLKYLRALILYHAADDITLYSDAIYRTEETSSFPVHNIPKGLYHIDLPTGLEGKQLSVDIARYGRLITIKINGFTRVTVSDGIAADGVIHAISNVLIPPKQPGAAAIVADDSLSVEEFKEALAPLVDEMEESYNWEL